MGHLIDQKSRFAFTFFCIFEHTRLVGVGKLQSIFKFLPVSSKVCQHSRTIILVLFSKGQLPNISNLKY